MKAELKKCEESYILTSGDEKIAINIDYLNETYSLFDCNKPLTDEAFIIEAQQFAKKLIVLYREEVKNKLNLNI